jgi:hypothetical protein
MAGRARFTELPIKVVIKDVTITTYKVVLWLENCLGMLYSSIVAYLNYIIIQYTTYLKKRLFKEVGVN